MTHCNGITPSLLLRQSTIDYMTFVSTDLRVPKRYEVFSSKSTMKNPHFWVADDQPDSILITTTFGNF